jgi:hypothetical protein
VVPAGIADDFVISTLGALKFIMLAQECGCWVHAERAKDNGSSIFIKNRECI